MAEDIKRKLTTILAADVEGYSRLAGNLLTLMRNKVSCVVIAAGNTADY